MKTISMLFLAAALLVLPVRALGAEPAAERTALEQSRAQAAALLREGRTREALDLYQRLLAVHPDTPQIYYEAFKAYQATGRVRDALAVGELARERFQNRRPTLTETSAEARRFVVHGAVRAGVLFDSNANQGPSSNLLDLGDWKNVKVIGAKERSSFGTDASANLDMGYRLNDTGTFWAVGDAFFFWRGNENAGLDDIDSREWQSGRAAAGIRLLNDRHLFDLRFKGEIFDYEFDNHVAALGPEIRYVFAALPRLHFISAVNLDQRDYNKNSQRNGLYGSVGEYARLYFGEARHEFLIGAVYLYGGVDEKNYRYDGWQGTARFAFNLPSGFTASPFVSFGQEFYKGPATALETEDREDDRWRAGLDLSYAINESWSIEAGYAYTNNDSRSELYTYDQHVLSMGVAWKF